MQNKILNEVKDYKINFIPTFYINDKKFVGVFSEEEFNKIINNLK
ncbi:thioredoxin domain-containing protein [Clostridium perfringens]|nr:thioredoxin domain-containing protein [Clostridium perfringens]